MAWSLKTKLRLSIFGLVLAVVLAYSWVYLSLLTRREYEASFDLGQYVTREVSHQARQALERTLSQETSWRASSDPQALRRIARQVTAANPQLTLLLESSVGYSYTIFDAAIVDEDNLNVAHSDSTKVGQRAPGRYSFEPLLSAGVLRQLRVAYGPARVYEISLPLVLDQVSFGEVRVGISTHYVERALTPELRSAFTVVLLAIGLAMVLAGFATGYLLRPLQSISTSLDLMTRGQFDSLPRLERQDEFGAVTSKLNLLGQQFRDAKENLAQVLRSLEEAILLFTRDDRAILANDAVTEFLGVAPAELLGRTVEEVFAADSPISRAALPAFRQRRPIERQEVELPKGAPGAPTAPRRVLLSVQFIPDIGGGSDAGHLAALVILRDVESVRRLESQIELSHRLAAIGRLTSGVAHEVKNPLNAIVLHLEALKAKLARGPAEGVGEHLEIIGREIYRLDRVVKTFLDFTRPVELALCETELNPLVEEVVRLAEAEAAPRRVRIVFEHNGLRPRVRVDRDLVKQAVLNVVLNGCQAMPQGGLLSITETVQDDQVELRIADQGTGIRPEICDKIFDLYFTTREKGSGIGLPMAFRVFQLHNGSIEFESEVDRGTVFRLRLPLAERQT